VLFGGEDILINNIAWTLRTFPVFGIFGDGNYRLQPIYVDDLARLAVEQGTHREPVTLDAIGPETFTFRELVTEIGGIIGRQRPLVSIPPGLGYLASRLIGWAKGDVFVTREEIEGLMANLLVTDSAPTGATALTAWGRQHAAVLGESYHSELSRRLGVAMGG
jgi:NADH dehydrogenase